VFIAAAINVSEDKDIMILDILGAFLHVLTNNEVIMSLKGPLAVIMVLIDPEQYHPHVAHDKKSDYVLRKSEQSASWAAKLCYGLLPQTLREIGGKGIQNQPI
jgi:hypothetical protein